MRVPVHESTGIAANGSARENIAPANSLVGTPAHSGQQLAELENYSAAQTLTGAMKVLSDRPHLKNNGLKYSAAYSDNASSVVQGNTRVSASLRVQTIHLDVPD